MSLAPLLTQEEHRPGSGGGGGGGGGGKGVERGEGESERGGQREREGEGNGRDFSRPRFFNSAYLDHETNRSIFFLFLLPLLLSFLSLLGSIGCISLARFYTLYKTFFVSLTGLLILDYFRKGEWKEFRVLDGRRKRSEIVEQICTSLFEILIRVN